MTKKNYNYNCELIKPKKSINCNRNNPIIALREKINIIRNKKEVKNYIPPNGINKKKENYVSYDNQNIPFYIIERDVENTHLVPCIIYFHGGGFMMPLQIMMFQNAVYYTMKTGYKVMLPEYRYAPEVSCRTTLEDCFYMIVHIKNNYQKYGIDPEKIIIYGESAGGALAAGMTHIMRERKIPMAAGQMLIYPAMDYHYQKYNSMEKYKYAVWSKKSNIFMWKYYLKGANPNIIPYAAPMNMNDFKNLPPAYIEPQEIDSICDEGIAYAKKLENAGVFTELNVISGSYHGFDFDHTSSLVQKILKHRCDVMKKFCQNNIIER